MSIARRFASLLAASAHMSEGMAFVQFIEQGYPLPELSVVQFQMLNDVISVASSRVYINYSYL